MIEVDVSPGDARIRVQVEVHVVGAHVCLTFWERGQKLERVWLTWLPAELPHLAMCGQVRGRHFRIHVALWPRDRDDQ